MPLAERWDKLDDDQWASLAEQYELQLDIAKQLDGQEDRTDVRTLP